MKYYFGLVPAQDVCMFGDEGLYEYEHDFYYNMLEIGTNPGGIEDFVLSDSIGRSIPIATEQVQALIDILSDIKDKLDLIETAKKIEEEMYSDSEQTMEW